MLCFVQVTSLPVHIVANIFFDCANVWMSVKCCVQQERLDIEEKYTSLQEEAQGKTKKLKKVWTMLMAAKSEVSVLKHSACGGGAVGGKSKPSALSLWLECYSLEMAVCCLLGFMHCKEQIKLRVRSAWGYIVELFLKENHWLFLSKIEVVWQSSLLLCSCSNPHLLVCCSLCMLLLFSQSHSISHLVGIKPS